MDEPSEPVARICPWCSAPVAVTDVTCPKCGAALAQREDLGGVLIPGLTGVDPSLAAFEAQPTHIKGPSPSQGLATGIIPAAIGGPAGLAIIGGIAAVAAAEYLNSKGPGGSPADLESVGKPSELALRALEKVTGDGNVAPDTKAAELRGSASSGEPDPRPEAGVDD